MKLAIAVILVLMTMFVLPTTGCGPKGTGTLTGIVTIGPLSPVQSENTATVVPCEVYEARKIVILSKDGERQVDEADIDCDGHYSAYLEAGTYTIDINHTGIDRAEGLPAQVKISANLTTRLDIDIDTGIR